LIEQFLAEWEKGFPIVVAIKHKSRENGLMYWLRSQYYKLVRNISSIETYEQFTGFGLYDRKVMEMIKQFPDPYPYFRGMIAEIGLPHSDVLYTQERRKSGKTKNNWFTLYDIGMLGLTSLSKVPLRLATFTSDDRWRAIADRGFASIAGTLTENPIALTEALVAFDYARDEAREIAIVWPPGQADAAASLRAAVRRTFVPNRALVEGAEADVAALGPLAPFAADKVPLDGKPTAYVCSRGRCELPLHDPDALAALLGRTRPY